MPGKQKEHDKNGDISYTYLQRHGLLWFQSGFRPLWGVWLILMEGTIYRQKRVEHNTQGNAKQHDVSSNSTSSGVILRYLLELAPAAWHTAYARHL